MSIVDTKPFMLPVVLHRIFAHRPQVMGIQVLPVGVAGGIVITAIMKALVDDGLIPTYFIWLFVLVGILGNIATINSDRLAGTVYTIGWLVGGLLLRDVLEPFDFIIYIVAPIVILILRVRQFIKNIFKV